MTGREADRDRTVIKIQAVEGTGAFRSDRNSVDGFEGGFAVRVCPRAPRLAGSTPAAFHSLVVI